MKLRFVLSVVGVLCLLSLRPAFAREWTGAVRGGSRNDDPRNCRSAARIAGIQSDSQSNMIGFRVVRTQ